VRIIWSTVTAAEEPDGGAQRLEVALDGGSEGRAIAYLSLTGSCAVGDRVLVNTTAVDLSLGTGGVHFVVAREGAREGVVLDTSSGGHVLKLRYTPLQIDVLAAEAPESPHHAMMAQATSLEAMPTVCCGLHSQVPLVAAAVKDANPDARVVYCATDEAALPIALSQVIRLSLGVDLINATVTCGQAFGGTLEAVNLYSGLLAAKHVLGADVAIVAIGPGVVGTATPFGHGGVAQGQAINAVAALGGRPVVCLRLSFAEMRARHHGVSHHTRAALTEVALAPGLVAVPRLTPTQDEVVDESLLHAGVWDLHERADVVQDLLAHPDMRGVRVTTMGRSISEDPAFFSAAFAAGRVAAELAASVV
jgi:hypothetical protein